jgi:hypothetical protein
VAFACLLPGASALSGARWECGCLRGQAILQAGVAKLIGRPDRAAVMGRFSGKRGRAAHTLPIQRR